MIRAFLDARQRKAEATARAQAKEAALDCPDCLLLLCSALLREHIQPKTVSIILPFDEWMQLQAAIKRKFPDLGYQDGLLRGEFRYLGFQFLARKGTRPMEDEPMNPTSTHSIELLQQEREGIRERIARGRKNLTASRAIEDDQRARIAQREALLRDIEIAIVKLGGDLGDPPNISAPATDQAGGRCVGEAQNRQATLGVEARQVGTFRVHDVPVAAGLYAQVGKPLNTAPIREDKLVEILRLAGYKVEKVN